MDTLRSIGYTRGSCLAMDPSKGGMAIQGPAAAAASNNCLQQFPYDPGFADPRGGSSGGGFHPFSACSYSPPSSHLFPALSEAANCNLREMLGKSEPGNNNNNTNKPSKRSSSGHHHQDLKVSPQERRREVCEMWTGDVERNCDGEGGEDEGNINAQEKSSCSEQQSAGSQEEGDGGGAPLKRKRKSSPIGEENLDSVEATRDGTGMAGDEADATRLKSSGASPRGSDDVIKLKTESEHSGDSSPRCLKSTSKPPEPPKQDYIHVRARRGQATDSHSLAERVRREKISERMKYLQDLVPGCSKVTGKALMLDEIINYVQSLQRQIEFLSMKLAAVNPRFDFNIDSLVNKVEMTQIRSPDTTLMGPDPAMAGGLFRDHHYGLKSNETACDSYLRRSINAQAPVSLVSADEYMDSISQAPTICDGDLQSIVQMGFNQGGQGLFTHGLHGPGFLPAGHLKEEL